MINSFIFDPSSSVFNAFKSAVYAFFVFFAFFAFFNYGLFALR